MPSKPKKPNPQLPDGDPATLHQPARRGQRGYTLIELAVVGLIIGIISVIAIPALHLVIRRAKLEGMTREIAAHMQVARQEAIKQGIDVVVAFEASDANGPARLIAFGDVPVGTAPPDRIFTPDPDEPHRTVDYLVTEMVLGDSPSQESLRFDFAAPEGAMAFTGFSTTGAAPTDDTNTVGERFAVFRPDGSIAAPGAFRFGDFRKPYGDYTAGRCGNCFEVRIAPAATAKITFLKYNYGEATWVPSSRKSGRSLWKWY